LIVRVLISILIFIGTNDVEFTEAEAFENEIEEEINPAAPNRPEINIVWMKQHLQAFKARFTKHYDNYSRSGLLKHQLFLTSPLSVDSAGPKPS